MSTLQQPLSVSLRPRTFTQCVGQEQVTQSILAQIQSGRVPRTWLFSGESGGGKTTIARIMALSYQFPLEQFGEPPAEAWEQISDFCIHEINASKIRGVDDLERIAEESQYRPPTPSRYRVYILDEAHRITDAAQNLLLKFFEEPASTTVWLVCTTNPSKLLKTIRRRCTEVYVAPLTSKGIRRLVLRAAKVIGLEQDTTRLIDELDMRGVSSPGLVLKAVERFASGITSRKAVITEDGELDTLRICRSFVRGDWEVMRRELQRATADDARTIRLAVLGYLRSILLSDNNNLDPARVSRVILQLSAPGPIEDPAFIAWVSAVLCKECGLQ